MFDIDGNGYIDANALRLTMQNLGEALSENDVKAMIREADTNGDGMIEYEGKVSGYDTNGRSHHFRFGGNTRKWSPL